MKVRSKALLAYLSDANVLTGSAEEITRAKRLYRKAYKRQWKQEAGRRKEIRVGFTFQQFEAIRHAAGLHKLRHTAYCRDVILAAIGITRYAIGRDELLKVLQLISMATIGTLKKNLSYAELAELLTRAESLLLQHTNT